MRRTIASGALVSWMLVACAYGVAQQPTSSADQPPAPLAQGSVVTPIVLPPPPPLNAVHGISLPEGPLTIHSTAVPNRPFTVTGTGGAILGMQDGTVELWQLPVKFFSNLRLRAEVDGYPTAIDLNSLAATLDVSPDHTTLTYSHPLLTVRQHMFVPAGTGSEKDSGGVILFEIHSVRPVTVTVSVTPALIREWPAPQWGAPGWDWQQMGTGGAYNVSTDNPNLFGVIAMPNSTPGSVTPYQEHPRAQAMEFRLRYDPAKNKGEMFPLLCELAQPGEKNSGLAFLNLKRRIVARAEALPSLWAATQAYYANFFTTRLTAQTPDIEFDRALAWAELAIDKAQARSTTGEVGLVAGWYPAFDSARPGFGWYFGRDTLWSLYAIDAYGDAALARRAMDFLIKRQRADGKMMHEYSLTADLLTGTMQWSGLPYQFAAADSTPLYPMLMQDYVRATGDMDYLRTHWDSIKRAYDFERTQDSDGDGVYDNAQGTGWVESWPAPAPHQELYLAALDRDASAAVGQLATWMGDTALAASADERAAFLRKRVEGYRLPDGLYAFSRNRDGSYDANLTVYPSVALWGSATGMAQPGPMLQAWSSSTMATDWGTRAVATTSKAYDSNSYHQGTVWPLFTGWTSMAHYRSNEPLAGYADLQRNAMLTWVQDPGSVTELLSGRFYQALGRSSTHQLWSSAMVLSPAIKGLFGLEPDAPHHALLVHPRLPATWPGAEVQHVRVGTSMVDVRYQRQGAVLHVTATSASPSVLCLRALPEVSASADDCREMPTSVHALDLPLPAVEVSLIPGEPVRFGDETHLPRVYGEHTEARSLAMTVEALAGTAVHFRVQRNPGKGRLSPSISGGTLTGDTLTVTMPGAADAANPVFTTQPIVVRW